MEELRRIVCVIWAAGLWLATTLTVWADPLTRDQIEARILASLGADRMIWAPGVEDLDITDQTTRAVLSANRGSPV